MTHQIPIPYWYSRAGNPPMPPDHLEPRGTTDADANRAISKSVDTVGQLALALKTIDGLLEMLGTKAVLLDTFKTDHRSLGQIRRDGNKYEVRRQS